MTEIPLNAKDLASADWMDMTDIETTLDRYGRKLHAKLAEHIVAVRKAALERCANEPPKPVVLHPDYPPVPPPMLPVSKIPQLPNVSGVYFIWRGERIHYVGKSNNLARRGRVINEWDGRMEVGDWISWVEIPSDRLYFAECFYIGALQPNCNRGH